MFSTEVQHSGVVLCVSVQQQEKEDGRRLNVTGLPVWFVQLQSRFLQPGIF